MKAAAAARVGFATLLFIACGSNDAAHDGSDGGTDGGSDGGTDGTHDAPMDRRIDDAHRPKDGAADVSRDTTPPPPPCGTTAWPMYGHDAQRTFASDACTQGPLTTLWRYSPAPPTGRTFEAVFHAVAQVDGVFLQWMASDSPYTGTSAADRVSTDGKRVWTFDSGTDSNFGNWLTRWNDVLVLADDGIYLLDAVAGTQTHTTGVDWWSQTAVDATRLYVANVDQFDGPGLFVGALDDTTKTLWQQNLHQACKMGWSDVMGGIALDGSVLFYAPSYMTGIGAMPPLSGIFAFDAAMGTPQWSLTTVTPSSAISAGGGLIFLVENGTDLVARSQKDGTKAWSAALTAPGVQAPVLAGGKVIVATGAGVLAFDGATGKSAWAAPAVMAAQQRFMSTVTNGCAGTVSVGGAVNTSMAAALASDTLVVTAADGIHLLSLSTGTESWHGTPDGGGLGLRDPVLIGHLVYVVDGVNLVAMQGK
jgi:hypothetical protein